MPGLLDPFEVKGLELRNRIVMPPMYSGLATAKGAVTKNLVKHYVVRSRAIGMVIIEHSYICLKGKLSKTQLGIHDDDLIYGLETLSSNIHATGTPVVIQINHSGKKANAKITGKRPVAPSSDGIARQLNTKEINALAETFAIAAERAMKAGFDGVEIHGAHGFLLNQFFSPLTNRRQDKYGISLENRIRFPIEVVKKVKKKIGGRLLLYRLGADDLNSKGTQVEHAQKFSKKLEMAGVDLIHVSGGLCGSRPMKIQNKQGYFIPQAEKIKNVINIPVIGVGGITKPEFADMIIRRGKVDLVAVGRALLKNPDWGIEATKILKNESMGCR